MPPLKIVAAVLAVTALIAVVAVLRSDGEGEDDSVSGTDSPAAVPEGYTTFEGEFQGKAFSFAYPEEWGEVTMREGQIPEEAFFEIEGEADSAEAPPSITLGVQLDSASPEAILQANLATAQFATEVEATKEEEAEVPGAVEALRAEATYPVESEGGSPGEFKSVIVVAALEDETAVSLILTDSATDPRFDAEAVASSLRIGTALEDPDV